MAKDNVHELRPLCPVTLTLKDGSVFTWNPNLRGFEDQDQLVAIWPESSEDWVCVAVDPLNKTYGDSPQACFDAMVTKARVGLVVVRDGKEDE